MDKKDKSIHHKYVFKKGRKDVKQSPCSDSQQEPNCKKYCLWHKNYFRKIKRDHFITAMSYASYQRKLVKKSQLLEKEIAGKTVFLPMA